MWQVLSHQMPGRTEENYEIHTIISTRSLFASNFFVKT